MMDGFAWGMMLFGLAVIAAMIGGVALLMNMDFRHKQRMRELEKEEHLALVERGLSEHVENLHWADAGKSRYRAIAGIGMAVGLGMPGSGMLATLFLSLWAAPGYIIAPVIVLWVVVGAVTLVCVILCLRALRLVATSPPAPLAPLRLPGSTSIQEKPMSS